MVRNLDAETFGHHIKNYHQYLSDVLKTIREMPDMRLVTVSELIRLFPGKPVSVGPCSWATYGEYIDNHVWYPLWKNPLNRCHQLLWQIMQKIWRALDEKDAVGRQLADKIINSCQFWHLSSERWNPGLAFKTMPDIIAFFCHCFGGLPLELKSHLEELERLTGAKIL
jgi:predicted glycosyl hydrolase (DUF1957 family)